MLAALALLSLVALRVGLTAFFESTDGKVLPSTMDASEPGFEAIVEPTPLLSVATVDGDGELSSVVLLVLSSPENGSVLALPADTLVDDGFGPPVILRAEYRVGPEALDIALDRLVGFDTGEVLVLDESGWDQVLRPAAPINVTFIDDVVVLDEGQSVQRWAAGPVALSTTEVFEALVAPSPTSTELARMARVEQLWAGWLATIVERGESSIAGELDSGLGRFLHGLSQRSVGVSTPPMNVATLPGEQLVELYALDAAGSEVLLSAAVPFPASGFDDQRLRVRILDGTGTPGAAQQAAERLVRAGAEIVIIGNAASFDVATTQVIYHREEDLERVQGLAIALGDVDVVLVEEAEVAVHLTVVLGSAESVSDG